MRFPAMFLRQVRSNLFACIALTLTSACAGDVPTPHSWSAEPIPEGSAWRIAVKLGTAEGDPQGGESSVVKLVPEEHYDCVHDPKHITCLVPYGGYNGPYVPELRNEYPQRHFDWGGDLERFSPLLGETALLRKMWHGGAWDWQPLAAFESSNLIFGKDVPLDQSSVAWFSPDYPVHGHMFSLVTLGYETCSLAACPSVTTSSCLARRTADSQWEPIAEPSGVTFSADDDLAALASAIAKRSWAGPLPVNGLIVPATAAFEFGRDPLCAWHAAKADPTRWHAQYCAFAAAIRATSSDAPVLGPSVVLHAAGSPQEVAAISAFVMNAATVNGSSSSAGAPLCALDGLSAEIEAVDLQEVASALANIEVIAKQSGISTYAWEFLRFQAALSDLPGGLTDTAMPLPIVVTDLRLDPKRAPLSYLESASSWAVAEAALFLGAALSWQGKVLWAMTGRSVDLPWPGTTSQVGLAANLTWRDPAGEKYLAPPGLVGHWLRWGAGEAVLGTYELPGAILVATGAICVDSAKQAIQCTFGAAGHGLRVDRKPGTGKIRLYWATTGVAEGGQWSIQLSQISQVDHATLSIISLHPEHETPGLAHEPEVTQVPVGSDGKVTLSFSPNGNRVMYAEFVY